MGKSLIPALSFTIPGADALYNAPTGVDRPTQAHDKFRISRTIADLGSSEAICPPHVSEAINYRMLDRNLSN